MVYLSVNLFYFWSLYHKSSAIVTDTRSNSDRHGYACAASDADPDAASDSNHAG